MISHLSVGSNDIARAKRFYGPLMELLGMRVIKDRTTAIDYGVSTFAFSIETPDDGKPATPGNGVHIAFEAQSREVVNKFHELALQNGGRDGGRPGLRPKYDANYYAAVVVDPDGNKIEAVTFVSR